MKRSELKTMSEEKDEQNDDFMQQTAQKLADADKKRMATKG